MNFVKDQLQYPAVQGNCCSKIRVSTGPDSHHLMQPFYAIELLIASVREHFKHGSPVRSRIFVAIAVF